METKRLLIIIEKMEVEYECAARTGKIPENCSDGFFEHLKSMGLDDNDIKKVLQFLYIFSNVKAPFDDQWWGFPVDLKKHEDKMAVIWERLKTIKNAKENLKQQNLELRKINISFKKFIVFSLTLVTILIFWVFYKLHIKS
jgi:hypothetical protein